MAPKKRRRPAWDAPKVKALRSYMGLTQDELAQELGTRQQTISESVSYTHLTLPTKA